MQAHKLRRFERKLEDIKYNNKNQTPRSEDEVLIQIFDASRDDTTSEEWFQRMDKLAHRLEWNDEAIIPV